MSWNYRICFRSKNRGYGFYIHEVYYEDDGSIKYYTANPVNVFGDDPDDVYQTLKMMMDSLDKDLLDLDEVDAIFELKKV